jgi:hypothetical protein
LAALVVITGRAERLQLREEWQRGLQTRLLVQRPQLRAADASFDRRFERLLQDTVRCDVAARK